MIALHPGARPARMIAQREDAEPKGAAPLPVRVAVPVEIVIVDTVRSSAGQSTAGRMMTGAASIRAPFSMGLARENPPPPTRVAADFDTIFGDECDAINRHRTSYPAET